jgi:hypothetical protein
VRKAPDKEPTVFSSRLATPSISFAAAVRGKQPSQQQTQQMRTLPNNAGRVSEQSTKNQQAAPKQDVSVWATGNNMSYLDNTNLKIKIYKTVIFPVVLYID